jgi:glycosyltransferase involved in cell wall biosynthesis
LVESSSPVLSVVIPVWNRAWCIERALRSIFTAGFDSLEAIVVDDGSEDGSLDVVRAFAESHPEWTVRWTAHPGGAHRGVGASRNRGAAMARGAFLAFLDSDDEWLPQRFDHALRLLKERPEIDGLYEAWEIAGNSSPVQPSGAKDPAWPPAIVPTGSWVVRKTLFDRVGGYEEGKPIGEDIQLWLRMAVAGRLAPGRMDRPVLRLHKHGENVPVGDPWNVHLRELALAMSWARQRHLPKPGRRWLRREFTGRVFFYLGEFRRIRASRRDAARLIWYAWTHMPELALSPRFWIAGFRLLAPTARGE